ncbi:MAG TPA: sigma-70 family RNA polymerase sigma factor [Streptosporangiaceae bacterium]
MTEAAEQFDQYRAHLRSVAFRMLGSADDADDAVQEAWLKSWRAETRAEAGTRAGTGARTGADSLPVENMRAWLTTIVSRVCLDMLRARQVRREELTGAPIEESAGIASPGPEDEVILDEDVGRAMLVILDRLGPEERVAFVLHDLFGVPFSEIGPVVDRTSATAKKLASRARLRCHGAAPAPESDVAAAREIIRAFLAASRSGDIEALLRLLAPDIVRRADRIALPDGPLVLRGADDVAGETRGNAARARHADLALVNGAAGVIVAPAGRLRLVIEVTIGDDGRITGLNVIGDPARLRDTALNVFPDEKAD